MTGPGPGVVNQVLTTRTGFGHIARCGCGWRAICETSIAALVSGQRHLRQAHPATSGESRKGAA